MAKKKSDAGAGDAAPKKTTRKSTKSGGSAKSKASPAAAPSDMPSIDTSLAAASAARMLGNRNLLGPATPPAEAGLGQESAAFKQLKQNLNKPKLSDNLLDSTGGDIGQKRPNLPHQFQRQVGHNQTIGHFNKTGVPRRTPG